MFPWPHSSHKQQSPPSNLCSPQVPSLQYWEGQQKHVVIDIQAPLNIWWLFPGFQGFAIFVGQNRRLISYWIYVVHKINERN